MVDLLVYCAALYLLFHVWNRSDLTRKARNWVARHAPGWFTYASQCSLCATWWVSITLWVLGIAECDLVTILAAPVINLVLDLVVRALIRANEPPLICVSSQPSVTTTTGSVTITGTAGSNICAGELVAIDGGGRVVPAGGYRWSDLDAWLKVHIPAANVTGEDTRGYAYPIVGAAWRAAREKGELVGHVLMSEDDCKMPERMRFAHLAAWESSPPGWEHTDRDSSPYRTSGILRWWPAGLIGRRVKVHAGFIGEVHDGRTGRIVNGQGPSLFGSDAGVIRDCDWFYIIETDDGKTDHITVATNHCTFLDGPEAPFNPLDHEQSK